LTATRERTCGSRRVDAFADAEFVMELDERGARDGAASARRVAVLARFFERWGRADLSEAALLERLRAWQQRV
jgi:hypothetical protein